MAGAASTAYRGDRIHPPLLCALFLPIGLQANRIYPWLHRLADPADQHVVELRAHYLNYGAFVGRTIGYFAVWILVSSLLVHWSVAEDGDPRRNRTRWLQALSAGFLPAVALTLSFASFDWLMSLQAPWFSSIYPIYYFAGGFVGDLALLSFLTWAVDRAGLIQGITASHYYALGRLLLGFVVFWAYAAFFQLLLIWIANKPAEVSFYLARLRGGWRAMSVTLAVTHFLVPFVVLLSYDIKRRRGRLAVVALWILCAHCLDVHWLVMPAGFPSGPIFAWVDPCALFAVVGATSAYGVAIFRARNAVPINDPGLTRAIRYDSR